MVYAYVAYNENKEIVKGKLEAKNEEHATSLLSYAGYQLIHLKAVATFPTLDKLMLRLSPVKPNEIILFYRQVALLVESGLNIVTAIELLEEQATKRVFKRVLGEIIEDIRGGSQLSVALGKHPEVFPPIHCQSLKVGEQTGGLETVLRQMADHMEKQLIAGKGVKNAMMYPVKENKPLNNEITKLPVIEEKLNFATPDALASPVLRDMNIRISDLAREEIVIRNRIFENCHIYGPAIIYPMKGTVISYNTFTEITLDGVFVVTLNKEVAGAIGLENCTITHCTLHKISFIGDSNEINYIKKGSKITTR